jgi:hypothetical protein
MPNEPTAAQALYPNLRSQIPETKQQSSVSIVGSSVSIAEAMYPKPPPPHPFSSEALLRDLKELNRRMREGRKR